MLTERNCMRIYSIPWINIDDSRKLEVYSDNKVSSTKDICNLSGDINNSPCYDTILEICLPFSCYILLFIKNGPFRKPKMPT